MYFSQMLALSIGDNLHIARMPRTVLLVIALVLGTAVGSVAVTASGSYLDWPAAWGLVWGGLIALVYFKRRRDEELAVALHAAQLAHMELKKKALESNLQLIQAQVEPQFLFNTLRRVRDHYDTDRSAADRLLENLIIYLRATLPQMRDSTSTLEQETQLTQAYLNIECTRLHGRLDFAFDIPDHLFSAAFPPMLLLPLIDVLVLRGRRTTGHEEVLRVEARSHGGSLNLRLMHASGTRPEADEVERIRHRLAALYGAQGKLEVTPLNPLGAIATLELPYAPT